MVTTTRRWAAVAFVALTRCVTDGDEVEVPPGTIIGIQVQSSDPTTRAMASGFRVRVSVVNGPPSHFLAGEVLFGREERGLEPQVPQTTITARSPTLNETLLVQTTLLRGTDAWVTQLAQIQYAPGLPAILYVDMHGDCAMAPPCPDGQTCGGQGRCVDVRRPLVPWGRNTPTSARTPDAAASDDAAGDARADVAPRADGAPCDGPACGPTELAGIAAGGATTCVWTRAGAVSCWGANLWDATDPAAVPAATTRPVRVPSLDGARGIAVGSFLCATTADGELRCAPAAAVSALFRRLTSVRSVAVGARHACALRDDGAVRCAGANESGQCGEELTVTPQTLTPVAGLASADAIMARGDVSCALRAGSLLCWGSAFGSVAASLGGLSDVRRADAFSRMDPSAPSLGCAVDGAGAVRCWGRAELVGLGMTSDPTRTVPVSAAIDGLAANDVGVGEGFACALTRAGGVSCWGLADGCRGGRPAAAGEVAGRPVALPITGARAIAVGARHACAVVGPTRVMCWGDASSGQLGHGSLRAPDTCAPVAVEVAP